MDAIYIVQEGMPQAQVQHADAVQTPGPTAVATGELDTPYLLLDIERLEANIRRMAELTATDGVGAAAAR